MAFSCIGKIISKYSVKFAVVLLLCSCKPIHSEFNFRPLASQIRETASGLSSLLGTISKSLTEPIIIRPASNLIVSGSKRNNTPAWLNSKMHAPTEAVGEIQKASHQILQVTKTLAGIVREAPDIISLPFLTKVAGNLDFLKKVQSEDVGKVLKDFNVTIAEGDGQNRTRPGHAPFSCDVDAPYRAANGSCNNLLKPCWGMATEAYSRWLPPDYENGLDSPRVRENGTKLPNPRRLGSELSPNIDHEEVFTNLSSISVLWGQFVAHDAILTPTFVQITKSEDDIKQIFTAPDCCGVDFSHPECFPIIVEDGDTFFPKAHCLDFVRSTAHVFNPRGCENPKLGFPRNQLNQVTSFIDASTIYGSSEEVIKSLRANNGKGAKLTVDDSLGGQVLPRINDQFCRTFSRGCDNRCLLTGEARATETPGLASLHTLWVREHNRIATILQGKGWDDETVFQETRKIIIALIQHITYNEFLPQIIGLNMMRLNDLTPSSEHVYDPNVNPDILNSFSTAAFRFGHSMVGGQTHSSSKPSGHLIRDFFSVDEFCDVSSDPVLRQIGDHCLQRTRKVDNWFSKELTNHLFADDINEIGLDLLSFNIQRGRDHGLPSYKKWRERCGLSPINNFGDLTGTIPGILLEKLEKIYGNDSVHDIDLYVAGISELPIRDASIGPTFACIVAEQFRRFKFGDRFWYENLNHAGAFTKEQLSAIKKVKLSDIICKNMKIAEIQENAFLINSPKNPLQSCKSVEEPINLLHW